MPKVKQGETEKEFVSRCIPIVLDEKTAKDSSQALAICHSIFKNKESVEGYLKKNKGFQHYTK